MMYVEENKKLWLKIQKWRVFIGDRDETIFRGIRPSFDIMALYFVTISASTLSMSVCVFLSPPICDVAEVVMVHKNVLSNLSTNKIWEQKYLSVLLYRWLIYWPGLPRQGYCV
jgi:hypothetical protein